jgi:putative CocE/NonD family hydrolase
MLDFANDVREMRREPVMARDVREKVAPERTVKLPRLVRFFTRQSRKGLPAPACAVALERGIRIPMPDGTHQLADRYIPQAGEPCPTLLVRTPYGRGFPYDFMYGSLFAEHGYNVLLQSTRGTGGSGGSCEPFTGEAADAQATIAWLREQSWFNGSLATIGASYLGFTQWALANDPPPELKAMVVQVSSEDFYGFIYPGGAFALEATLTGVAAMVSQDKGFRLFIGAVLRLMLTYRKVTRMLPLVPGYQLAFGKRVGYLEHWLAHPAAGDRYWGPRRANPDISSLPPVHLLGGWHDVVIDGTLDSYRRLREAGRTVRLVVGPWNHTSGFSQDMPIIAGEALAWLRAHLTENGAAPGPAPVRVHVGETGGQGQWRDLADWPPPDAIAQSWHLHAGGTLADSPGEGTSSFRYDPHDPTPSVGGPRMDSHGFGSKNNGKLEERADVLVFTGPVIDEPQEVIGPVSLRLRVRGSSPDFDVFARLCDVDAKGASWNICDGLLRLDATLPADPDGWTEIAVPMSATAHRFAPGHRFRVQVSGGAHPRWARNTGTSEQIATATTLVPVDIEISHRETVLSLPVLPR